jgi:hypothetical protein
MASKEMEMIRRVRAGDEVVDAMRLDRLLGVVVNRFPASADR